MCVMFVSQRRWKLLCKVIIIILYCVAVAPVCKPGYEAVVVGALRHETLTARCEVLSDPGGDSLKFSWTYSKSKDVLPIPSSRVTSHGHVSTLRYTPVSEGDFGTLACWASNPVGRQQKPCLVHVVHASKYYIIMKTVSVYGNLKVVYKNYCKLKYIIQ